MILPDVKVDSLHPYIRNLDAIREQEFLYTGGKKGQPVVLTTRLMYYDLLEMRK